MTPAPSGVPPHPLCPRRIALLLLIFAALTANFRFDFLHTVARDRFEVFQADSQALAEQKIFEVASARRLDPARGFLVKSSDMERMRLANAFPQAAPEDGQIYRSQFGLQGFVGAAIALSLPIPPGSVVSLYETLMAAATAGVLILLLAGLMERHGSAVCCIAAATFLFCPILVSAGRNLYWALPLIMLPLVAVWRIYLARQPDRPTLKLAFPVVAGLVFLKCLCGYEYITCLCLAPAVALSAIWASRGCTDTRTYFLHAAALFGAACLGFALAMVIHFGFVWWAVGDLRAAIDSILARASQHISGSGAHSGVPEKYQHGLSGLVLMIIKYLTLPGIFIGAEVSIGDGFYSLLSASFFGMFLFVWILAASRCRPGFCASQVIGPAMVITLALLASVSWLVAAHGHALHHFHLNSMAFLPLILAFPLAVFSCPGGAENPKLPPGRSD